MNYILVGDDHSRMTQKLETILKKEQADSIIRLDGLTQSTGALQDAFVSINLFAQHELIIVENAQFLSAKNNTNIDPTIVEKSLPADKTVVFLVKASRLDTRKKAIKSIQSQATVIECQALDEKNQPAFIQELMKEKGLVMDKTAFEWFCAHVGYDVLSIQNQIEKISLYSTTPSFEDVKVLTSVEPMTNVFKMTDALFAKDGIRLLGLYRQFRNQNMEPIAICGLLSSQIRFIFQVRVLMDARMDQQAIAKELNASSGRIWNSMKNARRFSAEELLKHLSDLSVLDEQMKSGQVDKDEGFESYIMEMITDRLH